MKSFISIAALVVSCISVGMSALIYYLGFRRTQKQATLDAFNVLQAQVFDKLNAYRKADIIEISKDVHSTQYKEVSGLLARCAHFAVGVNSGIYSKTIVRRLAGRYLIYLYDKLEPLIQKKRQVNTLERHYYEFEMLIADIKKYYT